MKNYAAIPSMLLLVIAVASLLNMCNVLKTGSQHNEKKEYIIPQAQMTADRMFELRPMDEGKPVWMAFAERNAIELDGEIVSFSWNGGKGVIVAESVEDRGIKTFAEDIYKTTDPDGKPIEFRIEMREGQLVAGCYKQ